MIKLFLSVTLAAVFMGLVACEPTPPSTPVQVTPTPTAKTESADTVTEAADTPSTKTESTVVPKKTEEATQTPTTITETAEPPAETPEGGEMPVVTTESTGNVTGEGRGSVMEYSPGEFMTVKTETGEPLRCKFGEIVTYITSDGKVIDASKIRRDSKVRVLYHQDGDDVVVDKVIVSEAR